MANEIYHIYKKAISKYWSNFVFECHKLIFRISNRKTKKAITDPLQKLAFHLWEQFSMAVKTFNAAPLVVGGLVKGDFSVKTKVIRATEQGVHGILCDEFVNEMRDFFWSNEFSVIFIAGNGVMEFGETNERIRQRNITDKSISELNTRYFLLVFDDKGEYTGIHRPTEVRGKSFRFTGKAEFLHAELPYGLQLLVSEVLVNKKDMREHFGIPIH